MKKLFILLAVPFLLDFATSIVNPGFGPGVPKRAEMTGDYGRNDRSDLDYQKAYEQMKSRKGKDDFLFERFYEREGKTPK